MGKSLETRRKSIDANVEKDGAKEMRYKDSYDYLYEDDEIIRIEDEPLWDARDCGKATINTPVQDKQAVDHENKNMEPVNEIDFIEITDDLDLEDLDMQRKLDEEVAELEGIF